MNKIIKIKNSKNNTLVGILNKVKSNKLIILCHGYKSSKNLPIIKQISNDLSKSNIDTFRFDFTGHGESSGLYQFNIIQQVNDIYSIINHFNKKYEEIILIGCSFSAFIATIASIKNKNIKKLITINGLFNLDNFGIKTTMLKLFKNKQWKYFKNNFKPKLLEIESLIIYGKNDSIVNKNNSINFYKNISSNKKIIELKNSDHYLTNSNDYSKMIKKIIEWISL